MKLYIHEYKHKGNDNSTIDRNLTLNLPQMMSSVKQKRKFHNKIDMLRAAH